ncbi:MULTISPECIES: hypothetical protein [Rhizobium/Agrobacterium group]|uniref:hypothetical protein n=1 Tax=Rhizobium/Agrobacterium group TaxID=227290 RepID=UPI0011132E98|nr:MULTISPECIES: hypothetical protein [Rhizobium/Agrobacterium group]MCF1436519.1 hypothetical protein [Allorhizobium ampelinum]MCF1464462.1 hypothetical protein [Allorhizobium ampelinum]MCF1495830.1 hypothetical protein [Allorhizobium ampelinum]MUO91196.1 hypothetical protein [Agrobacterium vitis]MUZ54269.1 hypothetical protein [Agrobacterium vitis]
MTQNMCRSSLMIYKCCWKAKGPTKMHTVKIIVAGLLIWTAINILSHLWVEKFSTGLGLAVFLGLWLVISVVHLSIGVFHAGYSLAEEFSILSIVFLLPAAIAFGTFLGRMRSMAPAMSQSQLRHFRFLARL